MYKRQAIILNKMPNINYKQGKISSISNEGRFPTLVSFEEGRSEIFDYAATRYGNKKERSISISDRQSDGWGDFLLNDIIDKENDGYGTQRHNGSLKLAIQDLPVKSKKRHTVNKKLYVLRYWMRNSEDSEPLPKETDLIETEEKLVELLTSKEFPSYVNS